MPVTKFGKAVRDLIVSQLAALASAIAPPQVLTIMSFNAGRGTAVLKARTDSNRSVGSIVAANSNIVGIPLQFITGLARLETGDTVVGVPIGPKLYYIVGRV